MFKNIDKTEMPNNPKAVDNLQPFKPNDERINRAGRPKKFTTELAEHGYKLSEVNDSIQAIMAMDEKQIKDVLKKEDATMLEKTVAKAIIKSYEKGSLYSMDTLLSRVFGKPKETVDATVEAKVVNVTLKLD